MSNKQIVEYSMLGECNVTYSKIDYDTVSKRIDGCVSSKTLTEIKHPDKVRYKLFYNDTLLAYRDFHNLLFALCFAIFTQIWQGTLHSKREGLLKFNNETLVEVSLDEEHEFITSLMNKIGASVSSKQWLKLKGIFQYCTVISNNLTITLSYS